MNRTKRSKTIASVALAAALATGVGAFAVSGADASPKVAATGHTAPKAAATIPSVSGGTTSVALDAGFTSALTTLGLTPGVVGGATLTNGSLNFPVTGGTITYYDPASGYRPFVQGVLLHTDSGLSLKAGETTVSLTNLTIDPGKPARIFGEVSVNGKLAAPTAPLFDLNGKTLKPLVSDTAAGTATLAGTQVLLAPEAAALLNSTFKTDALKGGFLIGVSTITINTK